MLKVTLLDSSKKRNPADLFIAGFFEKEKISKELQTLEPGFSKILKTALEKGRFEGKFGQEFSLFHPENQEAQEVILIGLGQKKNYRHLCFRKTVGKIVQIAKSRKSSRVRVLLDSFAGNEVSLPQAAALLTETANLAIYDFDKYKSPKAENDSKPKLETVEALFFKKQLEASLQKSIQASLAIAEGILCARNLINEPGNIMSPQRSRARSRCRPCCRRLGCGRRSRAR